MWAKPTAVISDTIPTPDFIKGQIAIVSKEYGVSEDLLNQIVFKESTYDPSKVGDTNLVCKRTGEKMRSRGIVQINDCWHPEVGDQEAFDIDYSLRFLATNIKNGRCREWSTCPEQMRR